MASIRQVRCVAVVFVALLIPPCGGDGGGSGSKAGLRTAPDFQLVDMNPKSKTHDTSVSPRDYLGMVPGFYFTHAN